VARAATYMKITASLATGYHAWQKLYRLKHVLFAKQYRHVPDFIDINPVHTHLRVPYMIVPHRPADCYFVKQFTRRQGNIQRFISVEPDCNFPRLVTYVRKHKHVIGFGESERVKSIIVGARSD